MSEQMLTNLISKHGKAGAQRILALASGYREIPVSIDEFVESDEYLGQETDNGRLIYPGWRTRLRDEFPDPFTTRSDIIVLSGCIGAGKSTFSRIAGLYCLHKMLCLEDPKKFYGHTPSTKYLLFAWSPTKATGGDLIVGEMFQMMKNSPWFTKIREENGGEFPHNIALSSGSRPSANVGRAIFSSIMTEVNFAIGTAPALDPMNNFNLIYRRMQSRFMNKERQPFPLIIDSSISDDNDMVSQIKRNFKTAKMSVHEFAIWQIKPRDKFRKETFKVFCGDDSVDPFIITDENDAVAQMVMNDPNTQHRVIDVPMDFYSAFTSDLRTSIRDIAGIATAANVGFITSPRMIKDACRKHNPITKQILRLGIAEQYRDVHITSVFEERYWDKFEPVNELEGYADETLATELAMFNGTYKATPDNPNLDTRPRSYHIDLGLVKDLTGISSSYVDHYDMIERVDPRTGNTGYFKEPYYVSEWTLFVGAAPNDEVPIFKIRDFFLDLRTRGVPIWKVTLDGFQSRQIKQELITMGFDCEIISVDRTKEPYLTFKRAMLEGRWVSSNNTRLQREIRELIDTGKKIDHPDVGEDGDGSKDGIDSVVGSLWNLFSEQGNTELEAQEVDAEEVLDGLLDNDLGFFELEVESGSAAMDAFNRMLTRR